MNDFRLVDVAAGTIVPLPNVGFADVQFYQYEPLVDGRTIWHLAPVVALPYIVETDGRAVVDPTAMANPGLSNEVPVGDFDNQGHHG
ncbi:MAG: hypothetical protein NVSMB19_15810 [Vulcanimicrobiaceae bacterium]